VVRYSCRIVSHPPLPDLAQRVATASNRKLLTAIPGGLLEKSGIHPVSGYPSNAVSNSLVRSRYSIATTDFWLVLWQFLNRPTAPRIVQPVPAWKYLSYMTAQVMLATAIAVACFTAGRFFPMSAPLPNGGPALILGGTAVPAAMQMPTQSETATETATEPQPPTSAAQPGGSDHGLTLPEFTAWTASNDPSHLRYAYTLVNTGPRFVGKATLRLGGTRGGNRQVQEYPGPLDNQQLNLNVRRFLKAEGQVDLPPGFIAQTLQLQLQGPDQVLLSKVAVVRPPALPMH